MQERMAREAGAQNLRGLKALVIGLGILIVLGTALVIGVVVKRLITGGETPGHSRTSAAAMAAPFAAVLPGGAGADIAGITSANGLVAIWVHRPAGGTVVFVDPRTGHIAGTATLSH